MKARYRLWNCSCQEADKDGCVEVSLGKRPATLPAWVPFPYTVLGCDCGGVMNLVTDPATCRHDFQPVFVDGSYMGQECRHCHEGR